MARPPQIDGSLQPRSNAPRSPRDALSPSQPPPGCPRALPLRNVFFFLQHFSAFSSPPAASLGCVGPLSTTRVWLGGMGPWPCPQHVVGPLPASLPRASGGGWQRFFIFFSFIFLDPQCESSQLGLVLLPASFDLL